MSTLAPEMTELKSRLKATWMAGDYAHFATYMLPGALSFLARLDLTPGTRMLDVACGAGQIAIPAAARGARVTGLDLASNLVEHARDRAATEGLIIRFDEGDAEDLPYEDASFDLVVSLIGAMFAPRPDRVAEELARVCRPGGRIVMANWTPTGHVGQMFKTIGAHVPPSPWMVSPVLWGADATVRARFDGSVTQLETTRRFYPMHYPFPPAEVVEFFRRYYGPTNRAFAALDEARRKALFRDLEQLWSANNIAVGAETHVEAEYLEVVAIRR